MLNQLGRNTGQRLLRLLSRPAALPAEGARPRAASSRGAQGPGGDGGESRGDTHFLPTLQGRFGRPGPRASGGLCESHTGDPSCSLLGPYAQGRMSKPLEKPRMEGSVPAYNSSFSARWVSNAMHNPWGSL